MAEIGITYGTPKALRLLMERLGREERAERRRWRAAPRPAARPRPAAAAEADEGDALIDHALLRDDLTEMPL